MISVCIPTYNFDVSTLVKELTDQFSLLRIDYEIIVIDDFSKYKTKVIEYKNVSYIQLNKNIGRSKIRNLFLSLTKYKWLLFLDCDSKIKSKEFILKYINAIKKNNFEIYCGGRVYEEQKPECNKILRWSYGRKNEMLTESQKNNSPNQSFMSHNFIIRKEIFKKFPFDEKILKYGHEDTIFGLTLMKNNIEINHINNPIYDDNIEINEEFLYKIHQSIENLVLINKSYDKSIIRHIKLLKLYKYLHFFKLDFLIQIIYYTFKKYIYNQLLKGTSNMKLLNFHKLGLFIELIKNEK